jgi:hypothetical protein
MQYASLLTSEWGAFVALLSRIIDLDKTAFTFKALVRRRGVKSAESLLRLGLGYGPGGMSLREASAWAGISDIAQLKNTSLLDRLRNASNWFAEIVRLLLSARVGLPSKTYLGRTIRLVVLQLHLAFWCTPMPIKAATGSLGWAGFPRESVPDAYSGRGAPTPFCGSATVVVVVEGKQSEVAHAGKNHHPTPAGPGAGRAGDVLKVQDTCSQHHQISDEGGKTVLAQNLKIDAMCGVNLVIGEIIMENRLDLRTIKSGAKGKMVDGVSSGDMPRIDATLKRLVVAARGLVIPLCSSCLREECGIADNTGLYDQIITFR